MAKPHRKLLLFAFLAPIFAFPVLADDPPWIARGRSGMVASDSPAASRIGADVLRAGGNAFDAAVATSLALAVARPQSTGLGGGGFLVAYVAQERRFVVLDFRETAPAAATPQRYAALHRAKGDGPSPSVYGGNAVGVPGQLAGLTGILKRFGAKPLGELTAPAIGLAESGFVVDESYRRACEEALKDFDKWPQLKQQHLRLYATLLGNGTPPEVGEKIKRPDLARALRLIAERGPDAFYDGPIGQAIVTAAQEAGGTLTPDDLRSYRIREREPIRARFGEYEIVSMPPPSSGGVCIAETVHILQSTAIRSDLHPVHDYPHALVEAMKHAFADRARWLGDSDFADIPLDRLTSLSYAAERARRIHSGKTLEAGEYGSPESPPEDGGTSHFCVADRFGNVVALTETINGPFGSLVVAEPFGIILNNQMDDFLTVPGQANLYGLRQSRANLVGPGKRPLSSMSPTIVLKDGRPVLALGASGGPRIITAVLQVMLNVIKLDMPLDQAMSAVRIHHQWQPDEVYFDRDPPAALVASLKAAGHKISDERKGAAVQAIRFLPDGTMLGASDPRKGGRPAGLR